MNYIQYAFLSNRAARVDIVKDTVIIVTMGRAPARTTGIMLTVPHLASSSSVISGEIIQDRVSPDIVNAVPEYIA